MSIDWPFLLSTLWTWNYSPIYYPHHHFLYMPPLLLPHLPRLIFRSPSRLTKYSILSTFTSSARIMAQEYQIKGLSKLDLKNGEKREVEVEGIEDGKVLLAKLNGKTHAMSSKCTHYGAPLKLGVLSPDGRITCPWHGGWFFQSQISPGNGVLTNRFFQLASTSLLAMLRMPQLWTPWPSLRLWRKLEACTSRVMKAQSRQTGGFSTLNASPRAKRRL